jgi:lipocalin
VFGVVGTIVSALKNKALQLFVERSIKTVGKIPDEQKLLKEFLQDFSERGYMICSLPDDDSDPLAALFIWSRATAESDSLKRAVEELKKRGFKVVVGVLEN